MSDYENIIKGVTRENYLEKIEELGKLGYCTKFVSTLTPFAKDEDILNPFIEVIKVNTTIKKDNDGNEASEDMYKLKKMSGFQFTGDFLKKVFKILGGEIITTNIARKQLKEKVEIDVKEGWGDKAKTVKRLEHVWRHTYTATVQLQGRYKLNKFKAEKNTNKTISEMKKLEHFDTANESKVVNRAIRELLILKGAIQPDMFQKGLVLVRFELNHDTKNEIMKKAIDMQQLAAFGLLGHSQFSNIKPQSDDEDIPVVHEDDDDDEEEYYEESQSLSVIPSSPTSLPSSLLEDVPEIPFGDVEGDKQKKAEKEALDKLKARINIMCQELSIDDDMRHLMAETEFGEKSLTKLTKEQLTKFIDILEQNKKTKITAGELLDDNSSQALYIEIKKELTENKDNEDGYNAAITKLMPEIKKMNDKYFSALNGYIYSKLKKEKVKR